MDTGASACFVSQAWIKQQRYTTFAVSKPIRLALADGGEVARLTHAADITIKHGNHVTTALCYVTNIGKYDVILGMNWLDCHQPVLGFGTSRSMTFDHKDCKVNCLKDGLQDTVYEDRPPESSSRKVSSKSTPAGDAAISMISAEAACLAAVKDPDSIVWLEPHHFDKIKQPKDPSTGDCDLPAFKEHVAGLASVTQEDFEHYMSKMERPPLSRDDIQKMVPAYILDKYPDLFSPQLANVLPPRRPGVDHAIDIEPGAGIPKPHIYGLTREETMAVKAYIDEMIGKGFIRPSTSPYASPVLVVKKPSGGLRICVDYRGLNGVTRKNRNAPPAIKETLARMAKVQVMTLVDVIAAFNSVRVKEGHEEKTAFLTRYGLYEYLVMPFGLCNAPGTFQTFINETLRDYLDVICTAYLDDVLIYSDEESKHEDHVLKVLNKISGAGMYLDATKCSFSTKRVRYLGLILTTDGLEMDPKKVATVLSWQTPRCVKDVQAFLGFANFYRRFIKGFSALAKPLTELTKSDGKKSFPLAPDSKAVASFKRLKDAFASAGILAHFDADLETWLETDASDFITAAVLSQMGPDDVLRPVAFLSHKMNPAECNYEIYDKELLAIVRAFEEWRFELAGTLDPVKVLSDHQALQTFMTNKRLNRRQARWSEFLSEFNFKVTYRPGKQGTKPDALTRRPGDLPEDADDERRQHQWQTVIKPHQVDPTLQVATLTSTSGPDTRQAIFLARCGFHRVRLSTLDAAHHMYNDSEAETASEAAVLDALHLSPIEAGEAPAGEGEVNLDGDQDGDLTDEIRRAYPEDGVLQAIIKAKQGGQRRLPSNVTDNKQRLRLELGDCALHDGLLYVQSKLYIPDANQMRTKVLNQVHRSLCGGGHRGKHETYAKATRWYYWPRMTYDVAQYVRACLTCQRAKSHQEGKQGLLHPLPIPDRYWSSISMDYITHLPACTDNGRTYENILVIVDRLSKKKKFIPVVNLRVDTLVRAFVEFVWREEGYPEHIVSDRGPQFTSHF